MVEAAKELLELIKHAPEYTLWVLAGILFYKVFIIGSWMAVARFSVSKIYDAYTKKLEYKRKEEELVDMKKHIEGLCISSDGSSDRLMEILRNLRSQLKDLRRVVKEHHIDVKNEKLFVRTYLHSDDVDWIDAAIREKLDREKRAKDGK